MGENLESDFRQLADPRTETRHLPGSGIEVVGGFAVAEPPRHALFDFDGTLSLIREGWPEIMIPLMVEVLQATGSGESAEQLRDIVTKFVMELTGKQTIYQMIRLAEEVQRRGGQPQDPLVYKKQYHDALMRRIENRRSSLRSGAIARDEMLVPGSIALLDLLQERGVQLYLASGTDEVYVREEVALLGLDQYFGRHVYGAVDDFQSFSKAQVIQRILADNQVNGTTLLGFGDGYVEIQNVREVGGVAVGVASDEAGRSGRPDRWKRDRLIAAGAQVVVPDFADADRLVEWLFDGWPE
jgi:phosphoglycolate phosphatase-like HAD superfamily hydrolase